MPPRLSNRESAKSETVLQRNIRLANILAKLPAWADLDAEALLSIFREKMFPTSPDLTPKLLHDLFLSALIAALPRVRPSLHYLRL